MRGRPALQVLEQEEGFVQSVKEPYDVGMAALRSPVRGSESVCIAAGKAREQCGIQFEQQGGGAQAAPCRRYARGRASLRVLGRE
eukprot:CAMPEP_0206266442 /NCGR_PEP_ID=MMETSP0047_2-20121206/30576_1 /ASSEMBLY_ACC=CAM_ASM_000192 /TAXON_ID=195065 /ORGANISM="Chroomonas mesostigmatica_cf, Strain CCMP1168" /LENGTH=84 /DNA_ID=CAMNT_0053694495 /DNA_START=1558 /DNA_END=1812 /DNA_ORIENTATION=-